MWIWFWGDTGTTVWVRILSLLFLEKFEIIWKVTLNLGASKDCYKKQNQNDIETMCISFLWPLKQVTANWLTEKDKKIILLPFWRWEVLNQAASRPAFSLEAPGENPLLACYSFWCLLAFLDFQLSYSNFCLCGHIASHFCIKFSPTFLLWGHSSLDLATIWILQDDVIFQSLSHVWFFVTPWIVAHWAPLSMGFPRQEN